MAVKANEVSQAELLERDVKIQFDEIRLLRAENKRLKEENEQLERDLFYSKRRVVELKRYIEESEEEEKGELAEYLIFQREALGYSYRQFGKAIGVSFSALMNYEKGKGNLKNMRKAVENLKEFRRKRK
jgi:DNA-binding transcriptional regulator YiaG